MRAAAVAASLVLAAAGHAAPHDRLSGPFGSGAGQVWILRPAGPIRHVVVFLHGWKTAPPSAAYPWVGQFRPWLDHLAGRGAAVLFPRYQLGGADSADAARLASLREGLTTGFARLGRPNVPVVAAGYSFGASLAYYFAADARAWGLPQPASVDAIFPAGLIAGARPGPLPTRVLVLVQAGDRDTEAGPAAAASLWAALSTHPVTARRYELVRSSAALAATHAAPKLASPAARHAFWLPLDRLVDGRL
jgi:hypothetical protein